MKIEDIRWDEEAISHIARHGVEPKEVEEALFENSPFVLKSKHNRYYALGQAMSGRYLTVIFGYLGGNRVKIITARAMSESERRLYRRR